MRQRRSRTRQRARSKPNQQKGNQKPEKIKKKYQLKELRDRKLLHENHRLGTNGFSLTEVLYRFCSFLCFRAAWLMDVQLLEE